MTLYLDSTINFGKYSGKQLKDIPSNYLQWLKDNTEHTIKNRFKPKEKEVTYDDFKLTFLQIIQLEDNFRRMCTEIGRKLIYDNVQIPF